MKVKKLKAILEKIPDNVEIYVNAWSPQEGYDRTSNIKICKLNDGGIIIYDKEGEYYNNTKLNFNEHK